MPLRNRAKLLCRLVQANRRRSALFRDLFRKKPLDDILGALADEHSSLKRSLGAVSVTLLGIGAIIGTGIYATIGTATAGENGIRPGAGPSLMLSFLITAVVCAFTALCYAELASMVPVSGSAYTYSYATLGELVAWIIGWDLIIEYGVGNTAVAISWANYFRSLLGDLGIDFPAWLAADFRTAAKLRLEDPTQYAELFGDAPRLFGQPVIVNVLAFAIVALITALLVWGIKESATFNAVMVFVKVLVLVFFVVIAFYFVSPATMERHWHPFQPMGWGGTLAGAAIAFFAYIGFDAVSTVAEETKNPGRDLPIGILASLAICALFYAAIAAVFTGMVPFEEFQQFPKPDKAEPLTAALRYVAPQAKWATAIVGVGSVVAQTAVLLVFLMGQPRIFFSMARDGLLPPLFARLHPRFKTPYVPTILTGLVVGVISSVANIDEVVDLTNIGTLFAFVLVCLGIPILRFRDPDRRRPFRVPGGPLLLPVLGAMSSVFLMYYLPPASWWRFIGWLILGLAVYTSYGYAHSVLGRRLGRPARTPLPLRVAAVGFLLAAVGLFVIPHEASLGALLDDVLSIRTRGHTRSLWGLALTTGGLALGLAGMSQGVMLAKAAEPSLDAA
ncbi:MAG: amino acid permease [Isosphaeraceae bacterium]|nr:amino acid permease [Isosphaeraceae bacterium]